MADESSTDYKYEYKYDYDYDNETDKGRQDPVPSHWILPTLYSIFFLVGFLGNALVILVVYKRSSRRADTFILNLAVSDLLFVLLLPLWAISLAQGYWPFTTFLCKVSGYVIAVTRCASSLLMAVMSVDRYMAVIKGKKMHPLRTRSYSLGACVFIWAISVLVGCPSLVSRHLDSATSECTDSDKSSFSLQFKMVVMVITFLLPFAVVLFCYCRMAKYLWNYFGKQVKVMTSNGKPRRGHNWLRIVSCVVGAFCLSWLPYNTINMVAVVSKLWMGIYCPSKALHQALNVSAALAFANSCSNPLIYTFLDAGFRRRAQLSLPDVFLACRSLLPIPRSLPTTSMSIESTSTFTGN